MEKRPALGKGLSALIPDVPELIRASSPSNDVDIDLISPNEHQPRHHLDDARLDELARSIKANGVIQPLGVRRVAGGYRIMAGERRWRAAGKRPPVNGTGTRAARGAGRRRTRSRGARSDPAEPVGAGDRDAGEAARAPEPAERAVLPTDVHVRAAEDRLKLVLGTRVR